MMQAMFEYERDIFVLYEANQLLFETDSTFSFTRFLNDRGVLGWELVQYDFNREASFQGYRHTYTCWFKRKFVSEDGLVHR